VPGLSQIVEREWVSAVKPTGHKSHVSGWKRFAREFRRRQEHKDLARFVQAGSPQKVLDTKQK